MEPYRSPTGSLWSPRKDPTGILQESYMVPVESYRFSMGSYRTRMGSCRTPYRIPMESYMIRM
eukprot:7672746-Pyramimonas_sp.AAC.1